MAKSTKKRMGRPPGADFPHLIHVRISDSMKETLDNISAERLDRPSSAQLVREALMALVEKERRK